MLALVMEAGAELSYGAARRLFFCLPPMIGGEGGAVNPLPQSQRLT